MFRTNILMTSKSKNKNKKNIKINSGQLLIVFVVFSVLGWGLDTAYRSLTSGYYNPGGFTVLPFSPIYGFGALIILEICHYIRHLNIWLRALIYALVLTIFEYISGIFVVIVYGRRLWDYSASFFNLNGHVDLVHFIFWGLLAIIFEVYLYGKMVYYIKI